MQKIALVAALAVLGAASASARPAAPLPDLDQVLPRKLRVHERAGHFTLGFASAVDNVGRAAVVIEGRRTPGQRTMRIRQLVDGRWRDVAGVLRYVISPDHAHWHLLDFERYELRRPDGGLVRPAAKTGFCLTDSFDAGPATLPGEPVHARWLNECGRRRPDLLRMREGISIGFRDVYEPFLEGQSVDLTRLPAGRYVLVHRANPTRALAESDYANNAASVLLEGRWPNGFARRPGVRILARCPDSAACST